MRSSALPGLPPVARGVLKIAFEIVLLLSFRHIKPPEETAAPPPMKQNRPIPEGEPT